MMKRIYETVNSGLNRNMQDVTCENIMLVWKSIMLAITFFISAVAIIAEKHDELPNPVAVFTIILMALAIIYLIYGGKAVLWLTNTSEKLAEQEEIIRRKRIKLLIIKSIQDEVWNEKLNLVNPIIKKYIAETTFKEKDVSVDITLEHGMIIIKVNRYRFDVLPQLCDRYFELKS